MQGNDGNYEKRRRSVREPVSEREIRPTTKKQLHFFVVGVGIARQGCLRFDPLFPAPSARSAHSVALTGVCRAVATPEPHQD
jgi:hypothetical protein